MAVMVIHLVEFIMVAILPIECWWCGSVLRQPGCKMVRVGFYWEKTINYDMYGIFTSRYWFLTQNATYLSTTYIEGRTSMCTSDMAYWHILITTNHTSTRSPPPRITCVLHVYYMCVTYVMYICNTCVLFLV